MQRETVLPLIVGAVLALAAHLAAMPLITDLLRPAALDRPALRLAELI